MPMYAPTEISHFTQPLFDFNRASPGGGDNAGLG